MQTGIAWDPNGRDSHKHFVRRWRGKCLKKVYFVSVKKFSGSHLAGIGAPLLCCYEVESITTEHKYEVYGDAIRLCRFQQSFKGTMSSSTNFHTKTFIANAVLLDVQNSDNNVEQRNDVPNTLRTIVKLVNYRNLLQKRFNTKYNEVISSKKKSAKQYYLNMLGYGTIFARKIRM